MDKFKPKAKKLKFTNTGKVNIKPPDVIKQINHAKNTLGYIARFAVDIISNSISDIQSIFTGSRECLRQINNIRSQIGKSVIESRVSIFYLGNPQNKKETMIPIDVNTWKLPTDRIPYIFIYGINKRGNKTDAFNFFENFKNSVNMFNNNNPNVDFSNVDIYIVSYHSCITGGKIFAVGPAIPFLMWREWERRARITADQVVLPFLRRMGESNIQGRAITHSLGGFVLAHAAKRYITETNLNQPLFSWFAIAPAIPSNAFPRTGIFENVPSIAGVPDGPSLGTTFFFSRLDIILGTAYILANRHNAMGQTGALNSTRPLTNIDVTQCPGTATHLAEPYFKAIGPTISWILGIDEIGPPVCAFVDPS